MAYYSAIKRTLTHPPSQMRLEIYVKQTKLDTRKEDTVQRPNKIPTLLEFRVFGGEGNWMQRVTSELSGVRWECFIILWLPVTWGQLSHLKQLRSVHFIVFNKYLNVKIKFLNKFIVLIFLFFSFILGCLHVVYAYIYQWVLDNYLSSSMCQTLG